MKKGNPYLRAGTLEAVDNQIRQNNPPETRRALERMLAQGIPEKEARRLIACVLVVEVFEVHKQERPYDNAKYTAALNRLPELPEELK
jgi:hypothetical protein